eukprot:12612444-Alexandrium_andersonii.AAC.1
MSASLVGSEMCIRDRGFSARRGPRAGAEVPQSVLYVGVATTPVGCRPVSYTHLTLPTICSV